MPTAIAATVVLNCLSIQIIGALPRSAIPMWLPHRGPRTPVQSLAGTPNLTLCRWEPHPHRGCSAPSRFATAQGWPAALLLHPNAAATLHQRAAAARGARDPARSCPAGALPAPRRLCGTIQPCHSSKGYTADVGVPLQLFSRVHRHSKSADQSAPASLVST
jgi:hypothetical protein